MKAKKWGLSVLLTLIFVLIIALLVQLSPVLLNTFNSTPGWNIVVYPPDYLLLLTGGLLAAFILFIILLKQLLKMPKLKGVGQNSR